MAPKDEMIASLADKAMAAIQAVTNKYLDNVSEYEFELKGVSFENTPVVVSMTETVPRYSVEGETTLQEEKRQETRTAMKLTVQDFKIRLKMHERVKS
jgi:hypothetical protein